MADEAFVTLATTDDYALGALVLAYSLRRMGTTRKIAVIITAQVSHIVKEQLARVFDEVKEVDPLDSGDAEHLSLLGRPELGPTLTKLHVWTLTHYSKCVFLDADTLVLANIDELFEREELSACYDVGWPDCFNSGVFVFRPSRDTFRALLQLALAKGSFDGADQGLLNAYFSDWATKDIRKHLPFVYNCVHQSFYSYMPAFQHFYSNIKVVHFIGAVKPWQHTFDAATSHVQLAPGAQHHPAFVQLWWALCMHHVQRALAAATQPGSPAADVEHGLRGSAAHLARLVVSDEARAAWSVDAAIAAVRKFTPHAAAGGSRVPPPAALPAFADDASASPRTADSSGGASCVAVDCGAAGTGPVHSTASSAEQFQAWREGRVDYLGEQSFERLESHMKQLATAAPASAAGVAEPAVSMQKKAAPLQVAPAAATHGHGHGHVAAQAPAQEPHRHPHPHVPSQPAAEVRMPTPSAVGAKSAAPAAKSAAPAAKSAKK